MSNTELDSFRLRFFSANQVIKRYNNTVSVLYRPNFRLQSNTALKVYSSYVVTRYYRIITTKEMKLLCASLIQFFYVLLSIHGQRKETRNQPEANISIMFLMRTTQLRTGLTACCALNSQRQSPTRKSNSSLWYFGYNLPKYRKTFFFCSNCSQTINDQPHFNIQIQLTRSDHTLTIKTQK